MAPLYGCAIRLRNQGYDRHWLKTHALDLPVISVGNITAGGTGKTPMVIELARRLSEAGHHPAVLMRGYQSNDQGSDEQREIATALPGIPVIAKPDRLAAAVQLQHEQPEIDVLILDDGFQHRRLGRQLDLVLIDATCPFGFDHILPRGLLREPVSGLKRADAVIVTRSDRVDESTRHQLDQRIAGLHGHPPLAHATHTWLHILDAHDQTVNLSSEHRVFAFCGLGNPEPFFAQAAEHCSLTDQIAFPDHHPYQHGDLQRISSLAAASGAQALLTTGKDWVKLHPLLNSSPTTLPVWRPELGIRFLDSDAPLTELMFDRIRMTKA